MKKRNRRFAVVDVLLILGMVLPLLAGITLRVLTHTPADGISVSGAQIYWEIPMPLQPMIISETQINSWLLIVSSVFLCLYLTHGIKEKPDSVRQHVAEWIVEKTESLVHADMGDFFAGYAPFVAGIMLLSASSSLLTLIGLYPPTSDLNVAAGWAILVFGLITYYKFKCGPLHYLKSFAEPVAFLTPLNVISEVATPVSMAFRHYGNILSGTVISVLVAAGLTGLSNVLLGWLPGGLSEIPILRIGIPAVLSLYFDLFSGCLQALIFAMLTMMYIAGAFPAEDYAKRKQKRRKEQC